MNLGTIVYNDKIYNLDYMTSEDVKNLINVVEKIEISAILNRVYIQKISGELVNSKVNNQLNVMEANIFQINPKFSEKSKNYEKISNELVKTLNSYESVLNQFCNIYDKEIEEEILEKVKLEIKLLIALEQKQDLKKEENVEGNNKRIIKGINIVLEKIKGKLKREEPLDVSLVNRLKDGRDVEKEINISEESKKNKRHIKKLKSEINKANKKIEELNIRKTKELLEAMEVGDRFLTTDIKKPRTFKKITRFFVNRWNTYRIIMKKVIEPVNQRIDEFKVNELKEIDGKVEEFDFAEWKEKVNRLF